MDYLGREGAPFTDTLWNRIDEAVIDSVKSTLVGRRSITVTPIQDKQYTKIDKFNKKEDFEPWYVKTVERTLVEIPQLYSDFWLYWRDMETEGINLDLSAARIAAQKLARYEDQMVFYGIPSLGIDGILTVDGSGKLNKGDWSKGEQAFIDIATAMDVLEKNSRIGDYNLILSSDLYIQLQRIQEGTGVIVAERIRKLIDGNIYKSTILKENTAILLSSAQQFIDLAVSYDINTSFLESVDMNHHLRIFEAAVPRIKGADAIVILN